MNTDMALMSESLVVVNRWRRYGKDRLYVQRHDGTKVGYWDLLDDTAHPESPVDEGALVQAAAAWRAGQGSEATAAAPVTEVTTASPAPVATPVVGSSWVRPHEVLGEPTPRPAKTVVKVANALFNAKERAGLHDDEGEDKVAAQLTKVSAKDPRWMHAHVDAIGAGGRCFDHVLVGPGGVFIIGSRLMTHRDVWVRGDTFMVDGTRFPYLTDMRLAADEVATSLSVACGFRVEVTGLLLVVDSYDMTVNETPDGIEVMGRMAVAEWLQKRPAVLPEAEQVATMDLLLRPATWTAR
jgi:hypothetical protein